MIYLGTEPISGNKYIDYYFNYNSIIYSSYGGLFKTIFIYSISDFNDFSIYHGVLEKPRNHKFIDFPYSIYTKSASCKYMINDISLKLLSELL